MNGLSDYHVEVVDGGLLVLGDSCSSVAVGIVLRYVQDSDWFICCDPPYGGILKERWDAIDSVDQHVGRLLAFTRMWSDVLSEGAAFYVWGGVGTYRNRPFLKYIADVESCANVKVQNVITWGKKRGYGTKYNYLFTREELLFMLKGFEKVKPVIFNVPYTEELRVCPAYDERYPAKSEYKRRTNVWSDISEIFRRKVHSAQKPVGCYEVPIEVSSNVGDVVVELFAGSGAAAIAAKRLGRRFVLFEKDKEIFTVMKEHLVANGIVARSRAVSPRGRLGRSLLAT